MEFMFVVKYYLQQHVMQSFAVHLSVSEHSVMVKWKWKAMDCLRTLWQRDYQTQTYTRFQVSVTKHDENCTLLGYYVASSGNSLQMFLKGPTGCSEKLVRNYHYKLHNHPEKHNSQTQTYMNFTIGFIEKHFNSVNASAISKCISKFKFWSL